uniref:IPT/TIG domain-containing protein n=1 Tax=Solibacter usitatus (strain Ellin6076) TaxID=234267 RepID=Q025Q9_SOLUE
MRWNGCLLSIALAALMSPVLCVAANFGTVVPIGGHASDIALDESRGLLYIANFTANRIEVMSTADYSIHSSMNVAPQPGAMSISPDSKYLLVAHYGNVTPSDPSKNAITLINLNDNTRQTFSTGDTPLALAFIADGRAFIVTSSGIVLFDPISGAMQTVATFAALAKSLPVTLDTFPAQVISAALSTNPDRTMVYGLADNGTAQAFYRFDARRGDLFAIGVVASPKPLARVSVAADGSWTMMGQYRLDGVANNLAQFPNSITSTNVGGNAIDSKAGIIYAQILTASATAAAGTGAATSTPPVLSILDAENLLVKESFSIPENITGRSVLSNAADMLYTVSDSGVMVFPVGRLNQQHRLSANVRDVVARGSFCNRNVITQTITITDPGGGNTDFQLTSYTQGVTISPSAGYTPAQVQVRVDPTIFQNQNGTLSVALNLTSGSAVNISPQIRLLINNHNPDQRGTFVNVPGSLTDLLADPVRSRFYMVAQDSDQVLVFDGGNYTQIAALKTSATPTQIAFTFDRKYLLIGHDNAQQAWVYDLDSLQRQDPIQFPPGHYPRSIAESGKTILALVRNAAAGGPAVIDRIDFAARRAVTLPSLGIYTNSVNPGGVLAPAPNGGSILLAMPDGNVMLYDANADTFTVSRKDFSSLGGAYAASSYNSYVVGANLLNASLVPAGVLESASGAASGFAFIDQGGFRTTSSAMTSPGVIERFDASQSTATGKPTRLVESPLMPTLATGGAGGTSAGTGPGGIGTGSGTGTGQSFLRSLAPLYDRSAVISLSVSGFTVLPWNYDAAVAPPKISAVVNAADGKLPVAPGGLISVYGQQMAPVNLATKEIPLPTALGESCLTVNGVPVPVLFVSGQQINGQLPFNVDGNAQMTLRTPGGISDNFNFSILPGAPSIFRTGTAGPETGLATITRADNGQLITPTNPVHLGDSIVIWATGLGRTSPPIDSGMPAPSDPLAGAVIAPSVVLGGVGLDVQYAGLAPGSVGLYQINATVPKSVPQGLEIPLVISQGGSSTTLPVRVVK